MTKEQKKAAIIVALREYQDNLEAVQESDIPGGFADIARSALVKTLSDKFERIFDQPNEPFATKTAASAKIVAKPAGKVAPAAAKNKANKKKR